jgi:nitrile hydratase
MADAPTGVVRDTSGEGIFRVGDRVRTRTAHKAGHTRLPRYVRGRLGTVVGDNGNHHLPDARAAGDEIVMQRLYTVSFTARELWGEEASAVDTVRLDLWESYLEPA